MSTSFDVAAAKTPLPAAAVKERAEKNNIKRARKLLAQWLQCINEFLRILREGLLAHEIRHKRPPRARLNRHDAMDDTRRKEQHISD
jgi:hypothetical protein